MATERIRPLSHMDMINPNDVRFEYDQTGQLFVVYDGFSSTDPSAVTRMSAEHFILHAHGQMAFWNSAERVGHIGNIRDSLSPEDRRSLYQTDQNRMNVMTDLLGRLGSQNLPDELRVKLDYIRENFPHLVHNREAILNFEDRDSRDAFFQGRAQERQNNFPAAGSPFYNVTYPDNPDCGMGYIGGDGSYIINCPDGNGKGLGSAFGKARDGNIPENLGQEHRPGVQVGVRGTEPGLAVL